MIDILLPEEQREGTQVTMQQWLVAVGDYVMADQPLAELETDKVTMEVCAPCEGVVEQILVDSGAEIAPDTVLARLTDQAKTKTLDVTHAQSIGHVATATPAPALISSPQDESVDSARHLIGPAVRRLLREHAIDIEQVPGSGRHGRVTRNDVLAFINNPQPRTDVEHRQLSPGPAAATDAAPELQGRMVPHTAMRKSIAKHMVDSLLHTSPHVTSVFEMDMTNVCEHRRWHKKEFDAKGVNLTLTSYFLAASVAAIRAVPQINARFHEQALEIFDRINIGVGTALDDQGLVVPVVSDVQDKDLLGVAQALQQQTQKARSGKLTAADIKNGTFTISNHGVGGSLLAAPIIINQPQVAILGIGKLEKRVVVVENGGQDTMVIKPMCYVSLTIDHRALDAYQTNRFLDRFVQVIEQWGQ